jgi:hypothetical protein
LAKKDELEIGFVPDEESDFGFVPEGTIAPAQSDTQSILTSGLKHAANVSSGNRYAEIKAALSTNSTSGPEYEAAKKQAQAELEQAMKEAPGASLAGSVTGAVLSPLNLLPIGGAKTLGMAGGALGGGLQGALINTGEGPGAGTEKLKNMGLGTALGGVSGVLEGAAPAIEAQAERSAVSALRPNKTQVKQLMKSGRLSETGRTILDQGIIGNVPRGTSTLAERAAEGLESVGAQKGQLIERLNNQPNNAVDINKVRQDVYEALKLDPSIPGAQKYNEGLTEKLQEFSVGASEMPIKNADELKTKIGQLVKRWYPANAPKTDVGKEEFYRQLYRGLNNGVDDAAEVIAKQYNPQAVDELRELKKTYGGLKNAEAILSEREISDFANRMVSPSDYGMGVAGAVYGSGVGGAKSAAGYGAVLAAANNFARRYGNQITSKQLDNLAALLSSPIARGLGVGSALNETVDVRRKNRIKAMGD